MQKTTIPADGNFAWTQRAVRRQLIMLVDEQHDTREVLRSILEKKGYKVLPMQTGEQALRWLAFTHPDLILMNVISPPTELSRLQQIHAEIAAKKVPILLTFINARSISQHLQANGHQEVFMKPIELAISG